MTVPSEQSAPPPDIYDPAFVTGVFDRCARRYGLFSRLFSFGLAGRWRRQCVAALPAASDPFYCYDLMAGTGEAWPHMLRRFPKTGMIVAVDISSGMHKLATKRLHSYRGHRIEAVEHDMLRCAIPPSVADALISTFGLKTFNPAQQETLAVHVARTLRPGGTFSFIEVSDPKGWRLRPLYLFYLQRLLPLFERALRGGAQDFATIGAYAVSFGDASGFAELLRRGGLEVEYRSYFFGCATGVSGRKPG